MAQERDPEQALDDTAKELEHRIDKLDDHIDDAKDKAQAAPHDGEDGGIVAGDWEGEGRDAAGGDDPEGAQEDVSSRAPEEQDGGRETEGRRTDPDAGAAGA